jgi:hypothetical protein
MQQTFGKFLILLLTVLSLSKVHGQWRQTMQWKAIISTGISYPFTDGFVKGSYAQPINFPTVNLGLQRMFTQYYGVRLDYGFNRFASDKESAEFKINYSRVNPQFVFNPTGYLKFLPNRLGVELHAGPGVSFSKPLRNISDRNQTYLNFLGGAEIHYYLTRRLSVFTDFSYIYGFTKLDDYNPPLSGLGAFNGSLINITVGLAISLSGCQYCD